MTHTTGAWIDGYFYTYGTVTRYIMQTELYGLCLYYEGRKNREGAWRRRKFEERSRIEQDPWFDFVLHSSKTEREADMLSEHLHCSSSEEEVSYKTTYSTSCGASVGDTTTSRLSWKMSSSSSSSRPSMSSIEGDDGGSMSDMDES